MAPASSTRTLPSMDAVDAYRNGEPSTRVVLEKPEWVSIIRVPAVTLTGSMVQKSVPIDNPLDEDRF